MVNTQVRQSESSGLKSRSGQNAYFHGVKTSSDSTSNSRACL